MRLLISGAIFLTIILVSSCSQKKSEDDTLMKARNRDYIQISLSTSNLQKSLTFYKALGFKEAGVHSTASIPWAMMSDGNHLFMISQNTFPSPSLTYYESNFKNRVETLQSNGLTMQYIPSEAGRPWTAVLSAPNGLGITLIDLAGDKLAGMAIEDSLLIGTFRELSIPVTNISISRSFWQKLGFEVIEQTDEPFPIQTMSDGMIQVGLYQTDFFKSVALTYSSYNTKNLENKLKDLNIKFKSEAAQQYEFPGMISFSSPDQQLIFISSKTLPL
jgi:predicted lactoylglutathione lyase